ncbi:MAG: ATP-grasp domain-containing protein [Candidatus Eisenbacteria bacterium]|uniref:ATP-grasp domain-containing protein n=1 Tax=Eiseniibacteriota bacterium TaxID=2212470 RepID=A0A956NI18_UNCEI|nr:ATP-grasp domain-containing protein [Candidatus Eisenbacteria bacterium]
MTKNDQEPRSQVRVSPRSGPVALLGYSVQAFEAAEALGLDYIAVVPPGFEAGLGADGIRTVTWRFDKRNENSTDLFTQLQGLGARLAIPLYEECVEWAGALNSRFSGDPRAFNRSLLFRDKAMMKRKAQLSGIRVGVFEEVDSREAVQRFFQRVNDAELRIEGDDPVPVHMKPVSAAGSVGHRMIRKLEDVVAVPDDAFPCMVESHLQGQEFSCEAFLHAGKVRFLNITEYIKLGVSQIIPPRAELEAMRPRIHEAIEKLASAFGIDYGLIHPEYFLDAQGELNFGEVANRVPGGHIFELIGRAYGFDPYQGLLLCSDPESTEEELSALFPAENEAHGHAANLMVYPTRPQVSKLEVPDELLADPYFERHDLVEPILSKVPQREGFGNHYGRIDFFGDDGDRILELLEQYEEYEFYV